MPTKDDTTLGAILLQMGVITIDQLEDALKKQQEKAEENRLGNILQSMDICPADALEVAVKVQAGLRSTDKSDRALAVVSMASFRKKGMSRHTDRMREKGESIVRKTMKPGDLNYADLVAAGFGGK